MDYIEEAKELVQNLDQRMAPSPYDIAWMARVKDSKGNPRWPELIEWLLENQHSDGSWGGEIEYYHDRIICTLIAAIALQENGKQPKVHSSIRLAEKYVWHHIHLLPRDPFELVGFELIFPTLLGEAREAGLDIPTHACGYEEIQTAKLRLIPPELLYSSKITSIHSLEFLGESSDTEKLRLAKGSNGSLGNSPATTAYYLLLCPEDQNALRYLENVRDYAKYPPILYPFRTFEITWTLNNLAFSGFPITEFAFPRIWKELESKLEPHGIGLDPTFGIPDGDITAVSSRLLCMAGYDVDPKILARFENKDKHIFKTYNYERNISISTNIHALEAVRMMPNYPEGHQVRKQISLMLLNRRKFNTYWIDKWHASPYYATSHAMVALMNEGAYLANACQHTIDWMIHTQHADGSWGFFQRGTAEETAYTLTALLHYYRHKAIDKNILEKGKIYLDQLWNNNQVEYHPLWIDKCLYIPKRIVQSAILTALILYEKIFG
jgi:halimadienyl-diphosphate synthase